MFVGFVVDNGFCVGIDLSTQIYDDAMSACQDSDAHLYYVLDQGYQNVLERQLKVCDFFPWIIWRLKTWKPVLFLSFKGKE